MTLLEPLLRARARLVAEASRLKRDSLAVQAPARVEAVVDNVRAAAEANGLSPDLIEWRYRRLVGLYVDWEARCFAQRAARGPAAPSPGALESIRARIDRLDREIVRGLVPGNVRVVGGVPSSGDADEEALVARGCAILVGPGPS